MTGVYSAESVKSFTSAVGKTSTLEDLNRRDKRILDAFEAGAISLDELKEKRTSIKRQREGLERAIRPNKTLNPAEIFEQSRLIVKGAIRFLNCKDQYQQKKIIEEIIGELHVREKRITAFKLKPIVAGASINPVVTLAEDCWIGPPPDTVPPKHKRCIKCHEIKPDTMFYRGLKRCVKCVGKEGSNRRHARKRASNYFPSDGD